MSLSTRNTFSNNIVYNIKKFLEKIYSHNFKDVIVKKLYLIKSLFLYHTFWVGTWKYPIVIFILKSNKPSQNPVSLRHF